MLNIYFFVLSSITYISLGLIEPRIKKGLSGTRVIPSWVSDGKGSLNGFGGRAIYIEQTI